MSDAIEGEFVHESTALAVRDDAPPAPVGLFGTADPVEVIEKATRVADSLVRVVAAKGLVKNIQGKQFPLVEAWTTLGAMLGVSVVVEWTRKLEDGSGWEARVLAQRNGLTIGSAEAMCTRDERRWKTADEYAIRSMAQTRATSKALRLPLGFIMTLAGYDATPADEIPEEQPSEPAARQPKIEQPKIDREKAKRRIFALCKELSETIGREIDDDVRHRWTEKLYARSSLNELSDEQLVDFAAVIQGKIDEAKAGATI